MDQQILDELDNAAKDHNILLKTIETQLIFKMLFQIALVLVELMQH